MRKILFIDDETEYIEYLQSCFDNMSIIASNNIHQGEEKLKEHEIDLILLDLNLDDSKDLDGLHYIQPLKNKYPIKPLIVVTNDQKTETVVKAMKLGADDFLRKSEFDRLAWNNKFILLIEKYDLQKKIDEIEDAQFPFIGRSKEIIEIKKTLEVLAKDTNITVLISGETGVGKEVAARYLYSRSKWKTGPFVTVHISSFTSSLLESTLFGHVKGAFTDAKESRKGYFKKANKGVLFLDEIGEVSNDVQVKLLRFLDTKKIELIGSTDSEQLDLQIIAATNKNLKTMVDEGSFRSDLYYRLKNFELELPPLRFRNSDIQLILEYYISLKDYNLSIFTDDALDLLYKYDWPGNIRQLKNTIEYANIRKQILNKTKIDEFCLPQEVKETILIPREGNKTRTLSNRIIEFELSAIDEALNRSGGRKSEAATFLGMNTDKLRYKILNFWKKNPRLVKNYQSIMNTYQLKQ